MMNTLTESQTETQIESPTESQAESPTESPTESPQTPNTSFWQQHGQKVGAAIFWLLLIGLYVWYSVSNNVGPRQTLVQLVNFMQGSVYGPLIFILVYTLRPLVLFSATILSLAGGYLFGPVLGVLFVIVGSNAGASLAYVIGRFFGGDDLLEGESMGIIRRWLRPLRENSFETVLIMRFLFLPYDLVNYVAGLLKINYGAFLLATLLGSIPGTLAFTLAGASIEGDFTGGVPSLNPRVLIASVVIFVASLLFSRYLKTRQRPENLVADADEANHE
jgi:uncharacterized membrane protein YdjX (TVP38/TMEM64 family)